MPQTPCWTQRPIHGQAGRLNAHSYITEGSGWPVFVKNEVTKKKKKRIQILVGMPLTLSIIFKSASVNKGFYISTKGQTSSLGNNQFVCAFRSQVKKILVFLFFFLTLTHYADLPTSQRHRDAYIWLKAMQNVLLDRAVFPLRWWELFHRCHLSTLTPKQLLPSVASQF